MKLYLYVATLALSLNTAAGALAAPVSEGGSEAAAREAAESCLEAIRKRDWKALADRLEPASLHSFKDAVTPALKRAAKDGGKDFQAGVVLGVLGEADPEKLLTLPPKEFFVALTKATVAQGPKLLFAGMETRVVGTVREKRDLVHVLYRAKGKVRFAEGTDDRGKGQVKKLQMEGEVTRLGIVTLKRVGGDWKALVPDELGYVAFYLGAEWREK
jgi:hypothetical protein